MNIKLPDEDVKTIDVDVKSEKVTFGLKAFLNHSFFYQVLLFSHRYKCQAFWSREVRSGKAKATWNEEKSLLKIIAPLHQRSQDLRF